MEKHQGLKPVSPTGPKPVSSIAGALYGIKSIVYFNTNCCLYIEKTVELKAIIYYDHLVFLISCLWGGLIDGIVVVFVICDCVIILLLYELLMIVTL